MSAGAVPEILRQDVASLGWRTAEDQEKLYNQRLVVVGAGGAGGGVAEAAVREGMSLTVADPDLFDETNVNRQTGAYLDTVRTNKAKAIGELACRLRGESADVRVFEEGLTYENVDEVLEDATLVLDAIDIARPDLSILLARKARAAGLPVFMGIEVGFGCTLTCFSPDADDDATAEQYFGVGLREEISPTTEVSTEQLLVHVPSYTPTGMLEAFAEGSLAATPGIRPGVQVLSGAMVTAMDRWVLGRADIFPQFVYPYLYVFDPIDGMMVVHANEKERHLAESMSRIGANLISSGFSLPRTYQEG